MELTPLAISLQLQPFIAQAFYLKKENEAVNNFKLVPRFFSVWAFTLENSDRAQFDFNCGTIHTIEACKIYSGGSGYVPVDFEIPSKAEWIVVMPRPHSAAIFWREDANHFANSMYCVSDTSMQLRILNDQINSVKNVNSKWDYIQKYLENRLIAKSPTNLNYVNAALNVMFENTGSIDIGNVAKHACTCDRNLRDSFYQHVGYSPKKFASMIRFNAFIRKYLNQQDKKKISEICLEFNYYDLSHLNKDLIRYLGVNVEKFLDQEQAINRLIL